MVMSSKQSLEICHRAKIETASKGSLKDPRESYGKYAYWCAKAKSGWRAKPCNCEKIVNDARDEWTDDE
jgi:hypothetical protein